METLEAFHIPPFLCLIKSQPMSRNLQRCFGKWDQMQKSGSSLLDRTFHPSGTHWMQNNQQPAIQTDCVLLRKKTPKTSPLLIFWLWNVLVSESGSLEVASRAGWNLEREKEGNQRWECRQMLAASSTLHLPQVEVSSCERCDKAILICVTLS